MSACPSTPPSWISVGQVLIIIPVSTGKGKDREEQGAQNMTTQELSDPLRTGCGHLGTMICICYSSLERGNMLKHTLIGPSRGFHGRIQRRLSLVLMGGVMEKLPGKVAPELSPGGALVVSLVRQ